jgi:hypothetical protein
LPGNAGIDKALVGGRPSKKGSLRHSKLIGIQVAW